MTARDPGAAGRRELAQDARRRVAEQSVQAMGGPVAWPDPSGLLFVAALGELERHSRPDTAGGRLKQPPQAGALR